MSQKEMRELMAAQKKYHDFCHVPSPKKAVAMLDLPTWILSSLGINEEQVQSWTALKEDQKKRARLELQPAF